jgi:hypothetical protein
MRIPAIAAVVSLALLAAGGAHAAERAVDRTFTVSPGGTLIVDADSASVQVTSADTNRVSVRMIARGSEDQLAAAKLDASQSGNDVSITMRQRGVESWFSRSWTDGEIRVTVPKHFGIRVKTGGGDVEVTNTTGATSVKTSGGDIVVKSVNGNVDAQTSGGGILAEAIRGDVDADTSGGDIRLLKIDGKIRGNTSGGDVHCSLVGANRGIIATTSGGSIQVTLPRATTANFEATTSGGEFTSELPILTTAMREGHARGTINGGGEPIDARTSGGDISLRAAN